MTELPSAILKLLDEHHAGRHIQDECVSCSSLCCSHPGFAILENVLLIHEDYKRGLLKRSDYEFPSGLSFREFVFKYFDVYTRPTGKYFWRRSYWRNDIVTFHVKTLSADNEIISIPGGGSYWEIRSNLFRDNYWLNRGCVFLSKKIPDRGDDDHDSTRHCILHTRESRTHLTKKPIDCLFYVCDKPGEPRVPDLKLSTKWLRALALNYPGSVERFEVLLAEPEGEDSNEQPR